MPNFLSRFSQQNKEKVQLSGKNFAQLDEAAQVRTVYYQLLPVYQAIQEAVCLVDDEYLPGYFLVLHTQKGVIEVLGAVVEMAESEKTANFSKNLLTFLQKFDEALSSYMEIVRSAKIANDVRKSGQDLADKLEEQIKVLEV